jgi:hypothetical protein
MCELLPNYNIKKIKFISSNPLVAYRIDKGLGRGVGRMVHLLLVGYGALNEQYRQGARVPISGLLAFHHPKFCTRQTVQSLGSLFVFFLSCATLVFFSGVLTTRYGAKVSL